MKICKKEINSTTTNRIQLIYVTIYVKVQPTILSN